MAGDDGEDTEGENGHEPAGDRPEGVFDVGAGTVTGTEHLLTPSKITAWLDCSHFLTLRNEVDNGTRQVPRQPFGSFAQLLMDKGMAHEADCLAEFRRQGLHVLEVPPRQQGERFAAWVERVGRPYDLGYDVIYQMPFVHDGVRGVADFLVRVEHPASGKCVYEPVDAKLARNDAKPGHVLQLCFYATALEAATGLPPDRLHLWLGSGATESLSTHDFLPYWNRLRAGLRARLLDDSPPVATDPVPCGHCEFCEFAETCDSEWRGQDSLVYVAGIRTRPTNIPDLQASGISTLQQLAECSGTVDHIPAERLERLVSQASLQARAREDPNAPPPYEIIEPGDDPNWGRGFESMPEPDAGDIFLDFEGDPFWRPASGLFFLLGLIVADAKGAWKYRAYWAHDRDEEAVAVGALIAFLVQHRDAHPGMHVYHYNHTERSSLERLAADHGVGEAALAGMIESGLFVDLYAVVRNAVQVGSESYGLKSLEHLAGYERSHGIDQGSGAVVEYERYMEDRNQERLDRIASYNEDDVRATSALLDWLVSLRPDGMAWRAAYLDVEETAPEIDAQVAALNAFGPDSSEHLLGELLGYWLRERRANTAPKLAKTSLDTIVLIDDPEVLAGLQLVGIEDRTDTRGQPLKPGATFRWPEQTLGDRFGRGASSGVVYSPGEGLTGYASIIKVDRDDREIELVWNERAQELASVPSVVVSDDWVTPRPKPGALSDLASQVLDPSALGPPNPVSMALLGRRLPVFDAGQGPSGGTFPEDPTQIPELALHLDHSLLSIQGPPGTGKTYQGARIVHELIKAGKRVGVSAMSHAAIDNLLNEIFQVFDQVGDADLLKIVRRRPMPHPSGPPDVKYASSNAQCARPAFNLVAGTTWLFSGPDLRGAPVDVLIIDEAGQLALADAVAASMSARSLVLLGDPLQLAHVSQASHPGGSGASVLQHVLGNDATIPADRGFFLSESRRMHPDVCRFISEEIYEGRLRSHPTCANQSTVLGTGLRWTRSEHSGRSTESEEEAALVVELARNVIGAAWVDKDLHESTLTAHDVMVVAPYNDQVDLLRETLDADPVTRDVQVGTVDKFQGQEAPVVFFTMTTSAAVDLPRGPDFLFSRNRLNVAISRAQCLAYLVCTEELLNSRARSVEEMRLLSTLCAFVEHCSV